MNKPEKKLHTHNSIPSYTADVEDGCTTCVRNAAIDECEAWLREVMSVEAIQGIIFPIFEKGGTNNCMDCCTDYKEIAKAIAKRLRGEA